MAGWTRPAIPNQTTPWISRTGDRTAGVPELRFSLEIAERFVAALKLDPSRRRFAHPSRRQRLRHCRQRLASEVRCDERTIHRARFSDWAFGRKFWLTASDPTLDAHRAFVGAIWATLKELWRDFS